MEGSRLALLVTRIFQLLFAIVVLGVSVNLAKYLTNVQSACNKQNNPPDTCNLHGLIPTTEYGAFVGAWGMIDAAVGLAAAFLTAIPWIAVAVLDGLAALFYLAGGIATAVWLSKYGCAPKCTQIKSDAAFEFLGFLITLALIGLGFMVQRGSSRKL